MLFEEALGFAQTLAGEHNRLRLYDGTANHASFIEPIHHISIEAFPCTVMVMQRQVKKCENCVVNCSSIDVHDVHSDALWTRVQNRPMLARISSTSRATLTLA